MKLSDDCETMRSRLLKIFTDDADREVAARAIDMMLREAFELGVIHALGTIARSGETKDQR